MSDPFKDLAYQNNFIFHHHWMGPEDETIIILIGSNVLQSVVTVVFIIIRPQYWK